MLGQGPFDLVWETLHEHPFPASCYFQRYLSVYLLQSILTITKAVIHLLWIIICGANFVKTSFHNTAVRDRGRFTVRDRGRFTVPSVSWQNPPLNVIVVSGGSECHEHSERKANPAYTAWCCGESTNNRYLKTKKTALIFWRFYAYVKKSAALIYSHTAWWVILLREGKEPLDLIFKRLGSRFVYWWAGQGTVPCPTKEPSPVPPWGLVIDNCNKIRDYSVLSELKQLTRLSLCGRGAIPTLSFVEQLPNLKTLMLSVDVEDGEKRFVKGIFLKKHRV